HPGAGYLYNRNAHDIYVTYNTNYSYRNTSAGLYIGNKGFVSNTASRSSFFLPSLSGFLLIDEVADVATIKFIGNYNHFYSELPLDKSYAPYGLTQYPLAQALSFFPGTEVKSFDGLRPVDHREWSARAELTVRSFEFYAEWFNRISKDDIYPIWQSGMPVLTNLATLRNRGLEMSVAYRTNSKSLQTSHRISFYSNRAKVMELEGSNSIVPVAGFSDVYKALIKGEAPGVIVGSSFQRDAANHVVVGNDGFPLVNPTPAVLGNPLPDFVMKMNHSVMWKNLTLTLDMEWKKGGVTWNGTQAMLDYYGRSAASAEQRNTTGYIFPGVLQDGHVNSIPVRFFDPSQPVENNRWTRYGPGGVAEEYIRASDWFRLNTVYLGYRFTTRQWKYMQSISLGVYTHNVLLWSPYKGGDPAQLMYDRGNTDGLDFFNLPSAKSLGAILTVQF
ncbi:MAG: hypothetical protein JST39_07530, partial [Bacteroidetes bacterium]|nr:hypothetical protein [Bacteroidota bacterium]